MASLRAAKGGTHSGSEDADRAQGHHVLSDNLQQRWHLLTVFPGTFDAAAAAAMWGLEESAADAALGKLVTSGLLDFEAGATRFGLTESARSFAADRLPEGERSAGLRRLAQHYLGVLWRTDTLYKNGGAGVLQALSLFDAEWANIQAGQAWAEAQPPGDLEAARLCSDYPRAGIYCMSLRITPRERVRWFEVALEASKRLRDRGAQGVHLAYLGTAYADLRELPHAMKCDEQALAIARELGNRRSEAIQLGHLGNAYQLLDKPLQAIDFYKQELAVAREIGDRGVESTGLHHLGSASLQLGKLRRAVKFFEQALAVAPEPGDPLFESIVLNNLGLAYARLADPQRATELKERSKAINYRIGYQR